MAQGSMSKRRVGWLWLTPALIALLSCAEPAKPPPPAPAPAPPPPPPQVSVAPRPPPAPRDSCGAVSLQYLVGKPRTDIPVPVIPARRRVICSECVISHDYIPSRQTITFDTQTGLVTAVKCG
jgi:hypothetical protein